jgi:hypothetical protein
MASKKTKVISVRIPAALKNILDSPLYKNNVGILVNLLLEDYFANRLLLSKHKFTIKVRNNAQVETTKVSG